MPLPCWDKQNKPRDELRHLCHSSDCMFQLFFVPCHKPTWDTGFQTPHRCRFVHSWIVKHSKPQTLKERQRSHLCLDTNTWNKLVRCLCQAFTMGKSKELEKKDTLSRVFCKTFTDSEISAVLCFRPSANKDQKKAKMDKNMYFGTGQWSMSTQALLMQSQVQWSQMDISTGKQSNKKHCHIQLKQICKQ